MNLNTNLLITTVVASLVILFSGASHIYAAGSADVANLADLQTALASTTVDTINITANISGIPAALVVPVGHPVTINGGGYKVSFTGLENAPTLVDDGFAIEASTTINDLTVDAGLATSTIWVGTYAIQVYNTSATLNNVTITNGNGGILNNNSTTTLTGAINVSGNGFGGIESSGASASLNVSGATFTNTSEAYGLPTIWEDGTSGTTVINYGAFTRITKGTQYQYYLLAGNSVAPVTLSSIAITTAPTKLSYTVGDTLDISGLVVTGTYSDTSTSTEIITTSNVTGFDSSAATSSQVLTVTFGSSTTAYTVSIVAGIGSTSTSSINLGLADGYAIFANTGIHTEAGASTITGDIGTGPGVTSTAITGFALTLPAASAYSTSAQVIGKVYAFDYADPTPANVNTTSLNMGTAYHDAFTRTPGVGTFLNVGGGTVSDQTLVAGVYTWTSAVVIPTDLTLSGSATDVWVFQINGTLDMAAAKTVHLTGGALPQNIFWEVTGAVNIGADTHFEGNILGKTSITFGNHSSINGRLLAQTAVTLDMTTVTVPISAPADTTAPVITITGSNPVTIEVGSTYTDAGATAIDDVDATTTVTSSGTVNSNTVGAYIITYTATDSASNTATSTRTVNVVAHPNNGNGGGGGVGIGVYHPAIPATPAMPRVSPAVPATPAIPGNLIARGHVLGASAFNFNNGLALGSRSDEVTELQNRLTAEGVYTGPITGYFGSLTAQGVKNFQKKYGISQVGMVGPQTRAKLNSGVAVGTGSGNEIPGCAVGNKFNTTTGLSCPVPASSGQGCAVGNKFSTTTGQACPAH